ncbi:hypothetical protein [Metallosphaera hakonensis]|uniref:Uncharacterized protein n=1 Tax=Metallosphaera hakonensis JCM 8857 = DSM 7519 TaxID=1293036 RepID=A0A2U9IT86_9CREN|nr:hypothetical protein [Metallosphaera hakonensis]AWR99246.1 hypothetical protein DFR87_05505 [Metallosphaera hakonensis JCM 8857 = DSM 7519]
MLRPLIAIDLNSRVGKASISRLISRVLKVFGIADVIFIMDDNSIVEFNESKVFPISDSDSVTSLVENLKKLSEKRDALDLESVLKLKRELRRSILIVVSDREVRSEREMIFRFNGKKITKVSLGIQNVSQH